MAAIVDKGSDRMDLMDLPPIRDRRPLAVQVYDRLHDALANTENAPEALPTEEELARQLAVSRTTVRQALALLEEDGVIERGPGRRRHIAGALPLSTDAVLPLEEMIRGTDRVSVRRVVRTVTPATEWNARLLEVSRGVEVATWESVVEHEGAIVGSALEVIEAGYEPDPERSNATMYAGLSAKYRVSATLRSLRLSPYIAGTRQLLSRKPSRPMLVATFTTQVPGGPIYLAKHVVDLQVVSLDVLSGARSLPEDQIP